MNATPNWCEENNSLWKPLYQLLEELGYSCEEPDYRSRWMRPEGEVRHLVDIWFTSDHAELSKWKEQPSDTLHYQVDKFSYGGKLYLTPGDIFPSCRHWLTSAYTVTLENRALDWINLARHQAGNSCFLSKGGLYKVFVPGRFFPESFRYRSLFYKFHEKCVRIVDRNEGKDVHWLTAVLPDAASRNNGIYVRRESDGQYGCLPCEWLFSPERNCSCKTQSLLQLGCQCGGV